MDGTGVAPGPASGARSLCPMPIYGYVQKQTYAADPALGRVRKSFNHEIGKLVVRLKVTFAARGQETTNQPARQTDRGGNPSGRTFSHIVRT